MHMHMYMFNSFADYLLTLLFSNIFFLKSPIFNMILYVRVCVLKFILLTVIILFSKACFSRKAQHYQDILQNITNICEL